MQEPMNTILDLHDHLFETLKALRDPKNPMDLERAKVIKDVAQTIVNAGKLEVYYLNVIGGGTGTGFIPDPDNDKIRAIGSDRPSFRDNK